MRFREKKKYFCNDYTCFLLSRVYSIFPSLSNQFVNDKNLEISKKRIIISILIYFYFIKGEDWIWVKPLSKNGNGFDVPYAAKIQSSGKDNLFVIDDEGQEGWITKNQVISLSQRYLFKKLEFIFLSND